MLSALSTGSANVGELGAADISVGGVEDREERETELCVTLGEGCSMEAAVGSLLLAVQTVNMAK